MLALGRRKTGFTLIEVLVTLAIFAMLLAAGIPSMTNYAAGAKVRNAAQGFLAGAQRARAEAIQTNEQVDLVLTNDIPSTTNVATLTASATGSNWAVRSAARGLIDSRLGTEGGGEQVNVSGGGVNVLRYNGLGALVGGQQVTVGFIHFSLGGDCSLDSTIRCVSVVVSGSGQARLCEPGRNGTTDARRCV